MDLSQQFDAYCERTDLSYWSEPINAVTNAAFIIAAIIMWRRSHGLPGAHVLCVILFAIGVGSYLFHTHATAWASLADVAPIGLYILTYLFLVNKDVMRWPLWGAVLGTAAFIPYAAIIVLAMNQLPFFNISNFYWTVPILLLIYALMIRSRFRQTAYGFCIGAGILTLSITLRSVDEILCNAFPSGTHFLWHCLNGLMLGYMIHVYIAHMLAGGPTRR